MIEDPYKHNHTRGEDKDTFLNFLPAASCIVNNSVGGEKKVVIFFFIPGGPSCAPHPRGKAVLED